MTPLLSVRNLRKHFPVRKGFLRKVVAQVKAVDDVSFDVGHGETLGLVGESGCGKTTVGRSLLRLIEPSSGQVTFDGTDVIGADDNKLRAMRRHMQIIFQDPYASLNPRMSVADIIGEGLKVHGLVKGRSEHEEAVRKLLARIGPRRGGVYPYKAHPAKARPRA